MAGLAERLYVCCTCRSSARRVVGLNLPGSCQTHHANSTHALRVQPKFLTISDGYTSNIDYVIDIAGE